MAAQLNHIPFINKYSTRGVLHVGAHVGEERGGYQSLNKEVLWIEADSRAMKRLVKNTRHIPNQSTLQATIFDTEKAATLNGLGGRSSLFEFTRHQTQEPGYFQECHTVRLDSLLGDDLYKYDTLVTDTQGSDLAVIKSLGSYLSQFKLIIAETLFEKRYKNIPLEGEISTYMTSVGWTLIGRVHHWDSIYIPVK